MFLSARTAPALRELTRDIAVRFNNIYGETFKVPEAYIPKAGARVMGLGNPTSKMSKSDPNGCVFPTEKPEDIARKFKRAITDSDTENCVRFDPENKPGVSNLMNIYSAVTGKSFDEIEQSLPAQGYGVSSPRSATRSSRPCARSARRQRACSTTRPTFAASTPRARRRQASSRARPFARYIRR